MNARTTLPLLLSCTLGLTALSGLSPRPARAADPTPGPDSMTQPGVPKGELIKLSFNQSKLFPGTIRDYWIYVPQQYRPETPACLYVNQDGVQWQAPTVFDNLIHKKEMPVTIGVFVVHGRVPAEDGKTALDRFNRSLEYDGLGDRYARFLVEELLPEVEKQKTQDGRAIRLSRNPNDRAIGGSSSGAVAAYTVAWERPDQFRRVFSAIGTYVGLRGADRYPTLLRKYEPKPLRVFLQDGINDQNIYAGDWWEANQMMERALTFAGYEVNHAWGEGGHNGQHGTAIFPDAMRWLWKGWPEPVKAGRSRNNMLNQILLPNQGWEEVGNYRAAWGLTANAKGDVFFNAGTAGTAYRVSPGGKPEALRREISTGGSQAFGPDGTLYRSDRDGLSLATGEEKGKKLAGKFNATSMVVTSTGRVLAVEPAESGQGSVVITVGANGKRQALETLPYTAGGLTLSSDQTLLYVTDARSHWVYSYQIASTGELRHGQQYYWLHAPDTADDAALGGMAVDREGRLYVSSALGIQVCDQPGRVNVILPVPGPGSAEQRVTQVCFGGQGFDTLYAISGGTVYRRKLAAKGRQAFEAPNRPPVPGL